MTEELYQEARKFMQKANQLRYYMVAAKGNVAKWTNVEDHWRIQKNERLREQAKVKLDQALKRLETLQEKFSALTFPVAIPAPVKKTDCVHGYKSANDCPESDICDLCRIASPFRNTKSKHHD